MSIDIRQATEADWDQIAAVDGRAFHNPMTGDGKAFARQALDLDRFVIGVDGDQVVSVGGAYSLELTMPGGKHLPMAGLTWIGVAVTHRRQGLLKRMMALLDEQAAAANEPLMGLLASEGGIYGRYGYGVINHTRDVSLTKSHLQFLEAGPAPAGSITILDGADAIPAMAGIWDRYRKTQHGELSRSEADFRRRMNEFGNGVTVAIHVEGFAGWKVAPDWTDGMANGTLDVLEFCASTPAAHEALWRTIVAVDLVGEIRSEVAVTEHDRLQSLLLEPRALRTMALFDALWLKVPDPVTAFGARTYRTQDTLTVSAGGQVWSVNPDGCEATDGEPDLLLDPTGVGALLMGGFSATRLALLGLCTARPETLARADAFFGFAPLPVTRLHF